METIERCCMNWKIPRTHKVQASCNSSRVSKSGRMGGWWRGFTRFRPPRVASLSLSSTEEYQLDKSGFTPPLKEEEKKTSWHRASREVVAPLSNASPSLVFRGSSNLASAHFCVCPVFFCASL